ncbi:hypothetical protein EON77_14950 [bacterium]|nr:MAG: hypothetical protein EON77_14950 [bacterium]
MVARAPAAVLDASRAEAIAQATSTPGSLVSEWAAGATRSEVELDHIRLALAAENGRVEAAARRLGMPRSTLYWKLKRFGMSRKRAYASDA